MPASSTRVAVAAAVILLLVLAGGLGWQRMRLSPSTHVVMSASVPPATRGTPDPMPSSGTVTPLPPPALEPERHASEQTVTAQRESAPQPPSAPAPVDARRSEPAPPSFDVVRVEPTGEALLAGHGEPNGTVALVDRGKVVAEAKADAGGNFVMTPPALKPGDYALSLREGQGSAARDSKQSVVVSVPATKKQQVVVAMAEPGKATTLLSAPPEPAKAPADQPASPTAPPSAKVSAPRPKLAIRSVDLENGSGLFASGVAPPGTDVRVYLNNSRVADVIAAAAGSWTVTVRKGLAAGHYAVRADAVKSNRTVGARVEVPFDVPPPMSAAAAPPTPPEAADLPSKADSRLPSPPAKKVAEAGASAGGDKRSAAVAAAPATNVPTQANVIIDELKTELVSRGDNLWQISRKRLGQGTRYTQIYAANTFQIRDPKLIYPGQVFVLPLN